MTDISYPANISYWEIKQCLQDIDVLIVGSGIVGLTTAIFYKNRYPKRRVVIVEKGMLPSGASTKNAGFACFGSPSEILSDLDHSTEDQVYDIVKIRLDGLKYLRKLVGDKNLSFDQCGGYEVFKSGDGQLFERCMQFLPKINQELSSRLGLTDTYELTDLRIKDFGLSNVEHLIRNNYEGSIDTGRMMSYLIKAASDVGIVILNGMELTEYVTTQSFNEVSFANNLTIRCKKLHIATNGFAKTLLPAVEVQPARAQVLITSEIENLKLNGTFHMNEGFYYFRNVGNRVLLGGGRELALREETTTDLDTTKQIQDKLDDILDTIVLGNVKYKVEHRWAGIMGVGSTKKPIVKKITDSVTCSVRLGGMGVAIGASIGKQSADLIG